MPDYVVLERRHAWSLGFERSLVTDPKPLLQGAYLIDGTLGLSAQGTGNFAVQLRLRSPNGKETHTAVPGSPDGLPALVEKMIVEIAKITGSGTSPPDWQPQKEAHEYLLEGTWGWQHNADAAALEALDAAELLGAEASDVTAVRIEVLSDLINAGMEQWYRTNIDLRKPALDASQLSQKTSYAFRAIQDVVRFRDQKFESQLQVLISIDPELKNKLTTHGLSLIHI